MTSKISVWAICTVLAIGGAACSGSERGADNVLASRGDALPAMRWDHRPEAQDWTRAALGAMDANAAALPHSTPSNIETYCPGYRAAGIEDRKAFWAGLFSALAKHESTWNPVAVGGGGRWFGLVQIAPATARGHGCRVQSAEALKDGSANLSCAVRIASNTVSADGGVSQTVRAVLRDWGPFHSGAKRAEMAAWTAQQSYCSG